MDKLLEISTPQMKGYIISQLDPFHDSEYRLEGAPSSLSSNSVVVTVKQERTISAADFGLSVAPGSKWDFNAALLPVSQEVLMYAADLPTPANLSNQSFRPQTRYNGGTNFGPLTISATASGGPTFTSFDPSSIMTTVISMGQDPLTFQTVGGQGIRRARLIGQAFEVIDESPPYYKQGAVTVYEQPSTGQLTKFYNEILVEQGVTDLRVPYLQDAYEIATPPVTSSAATLFPSSRTWLAKDGAYVVARKNVEEVPFTYPNFYSLCLIGPPNENTSASAPRNSFFPNQWYYDVFNETANEPTGSGTTLTTPVGVYPYNVSGAYFTGLSGEFGAYRIRLRQFFEVIPDSTDVTLVPLATPTLPRAPEVELLLQHILSLQPPGWRQSDNPKGEVWKKILSTASSVLTKASPIITGLNPALGALVVSSAGTLSAVNAMIPDKKKKKKNPPTKQPKQAPVVKKK